MVKAGGFLRRTTCSSPESCAQLDRNLSKAGEQTRGTTRWSTLVPEKVSIFIWRVVKERIPIRVLLDRCGIDIPSILCPLCEEVVENIYHILVRCRVSYIWLKFLSWRGIQEMNFIDTHQLMDFKGLDHWSKRKKNDLGSFGMGFYVSDLEVPKQ